MNVLIGKNGRIYLKKVLLDEVFVGDGRVTLKNVGFDLFVGKCQRFPKRMK